MEEDFDGDSPPNRSLWEILRSLPDRHPFLPIRSLFGVKHDPFAIPLSVLVGSIILLSGFTVLTTVFSSLVFWSAFVLLPYIALQSIQACLYVIYRCIYYFLSRILKAFKAILVVLLRPFKPVCMALVKVKDNRSRGVPSEAKPDVKSNPFYSSDESDPEVKEVYEDVPIMPRFSADDISTMLRRRRRHLMFSSDESDL